MRISTVAAVSVYLVAGGFSAIGMLHADDGTSSTPAALLEPRQVEADGRAIDVLQGGTCPFFGDFDGDSLPDLLLGQMDGGKLRIYRNVGSKERPRFGDFEWFKAGKTGDDGQVIPNPGSGMTGSGVGFAPQLVDFDGDGLKDVLTCAGNGSVLIFHRQKDGSFAEGLSLKRADGLEIIGTPGALVHAVDWDADGDLDLVMDIQRAGISLLRNRGSDRMPTYAEPAAFQLDDDVIRVRFGGAAPVTADWDGDGLLDLIIGAADGSVTWYRRVDVASDVKLAEGVVLVPPAFHDEEAPSPQPGHGARPCVCDFNADGRLDLLVGDVEVSVVTPEIQLTDEDREHDAAIEKKLTALSKKFATERKALEGETDAARDKRLEGLRVISSQMRQMRRELARPAPQPVITSHGHVWIYLRDKENAD